MAAKTSPQIPDAPVWATVAGAVTAGVVMSALMLVGAWSQFNDWTLEVALGSLIVGEAGPTAWVVGFFWHLINAAVFGLVYAGVFRAFGRSGVAFGALVGVAHFIIAGFLASVALYLFEFPLAQQGFFLERSFFWAGAPAPSVWGLLVLHLCFGAIVGGFARGAAESIQRREEERETGRRRLDRAA